MNKLQNILYILIFNLSGCSSGIYNSHFICPDANGLTCEMLNSIDKKIDSGEMDIIFSEYQCSKKKNCIPHSTKKNNEQIYKIEFLDLTKAHDEHK